MKNQAFLLFAASAFLLAAPLRAAEVKEIEAILKHEILTPAAALDEVQRYCDDRVPRMGRYAAQADWQADADRWRAAVLEKVVYRGEAATWRDAKAKVEWLDTIAGGPGYHIKKLRFEAAPGMWVPALLYEPDKLAGKVPVIMNVNGHSGTIGKAENQKQMRCINQARRGMIALNVEWVGMGQLNSAGFSHARMNQLDLCGTSGLAPYYLSMKHGLDILLSHEHADPSRVAVTGLSGGGWQTIFISSLDTRVKLSTPVAGYSSFRTRVYHFQDLGDSEQTPNDLATIVDYTHLTAMLAPRAALLVFNSKDNCCFQSGYALPPLLDAARPIFALHGKEDALRSHVNDDPGTHNYERDNRQAFYGALGDYFYPGDKSFDATEIVPAAGEVKTRDQLLVDLPPKNENFNSLATTLAQGLPRNGELPGEKAAALKWQQTTRAALRDVVKAKDYQVTEGKFRSETHGDLHVTYWQLRLGGTWTLPAVELSQGTPKHTALLISEPGRTASAADATRLLAAGYRVIAVDPLNYGESAVPRYGWLYCMLIAAVGDRPLGIQAGQIGAVARWSMHEQGAPVTLIASGRRCCVSALIAAALETHAVAGVELHGSLGSLKELIETSEPYNGSAGMELFCFGLLQTADIRQIAALVAPRPVTFASPSARVKSELGALGAWYHLLGEDFDPLR